MTFRIGRRAVLRGAGGVALSLPFLEAMRPSRAEAQSAQPKRFVLFFSPIGTLPAQFWPSGTGTAFTIAADSILAPLIPLKSELLFLRGINMRSTTVSAGAGHPRGMGNLLTGVPLLPGQFNTGAGQTVGWGRGISVDQRIASVIGKTKFRSIELGVGVNRPTTNSVLSYLGDAQPLPPENNPAVSFQRLFSNLGSTTPGDADALRLKRQGVLAAVKDEYQRLQPRLGTEDRVKLQEHLEAIQEVERQIAVVTPTSTGCVAPTVPTVAAYTADANAPAVADIQMKLLTMALKCDLTRVATLQMSNGTSDKTFPWLSISESHHNLSHSGDSDLATQAKLKKIYTWYASQFAKLVQMLKDTPDSNGASLLASTAVLWCSELSKGNTHSYDELPLILAGRAGGAVRPGRVATFGGAPHNNLHVALLNAMGVPDTTFGDPRFCTGALTLG